MKIIEWSILSVLILNNAYCVFSPNVNMYAFAGWLAALVCFSGLVIIRRSK